MHKAHKQKDWKKDRTAESNRSPVIAIKVLYEDGRMFIEPPDDTFLIDEEFAKLNPDVMSKILEPQGSPTQDQIFSGTELMGFLDSLFTRLNEYFQKKMVGSSSSQLRFQIYSGYFKMAFGEKNPEDPSVINLSNSTVFPEILSKITDKGYYRIEKEGIKERPPQVAKKVKIKKPKRK